MRKHILIAIGVGILLSGCFLTKNYGKNQIEIEQNENPMIWKQVLQMQLTLWPLERKVNELEKRVIEIEKNFNKTAKTVNELEKNTADMKDELATTKLSSIQAHKSIESLQAEIQQLRNESIKKGKPSVELPTGVKKKKEGPDPRTAKVAGGKNETGPDSPSMMITQIKYSKVTDTQDHVLIYVNAMNHPKRQTLIGDNPRIVLDFLKARHLEKENDEINVEGNFIRRIRIRTYPEPQQKVRVIFDMIPNKKYSIHQNFLKNENIYSFDIKGD